jgi:hypothetical protein
MVFLGGALLKDPPNTYALLETAPPVAENDDDDEVTSSKKQSGDRYVVDDDDEERPAFPNRIEQSGRGEKAEAAVDNSVG